MQTTKIEEGVTYNIRYREGTKTKINNWTCADIRPLRTGVGVCEKKRQGYLSNPHLFKLDDGTQVTVTSQGVLSKYVKPEVAADKVKQEVDSELDSDTLEALQDKLTVVQIILEGLGVKSKIEGTTLVLPFKEAVTLKTIAAKLLANQDKL